MEKGPPSTNPLLPEERSHRYLCPVWSPTMLLHDALVGQPVVEAGDVLPVGPGWALGSEGISRGCGGISHTENAPEKPPTGEKVNPWPIPHHGLFDQVKEKLWEPACHQHLANGL